MNIHEINKLPIIKRILLKCPERVNEIVYELKRVSDVGIKLDNREIEVSGLFLWEATPQGFNYWSDLSDIVDRD